MEGARAESIESRVASIGLDEEGLLDRRATLISLLRSLQKSFEQNDINTQPSSASEDNSAFSQNAGIKAMVKNPTSTLSHRGAQLASETLHSHFANQKPNCMNFREFRDYLSAAGRPKEFSEVTDNEESWKVFVDDFGGLDAEGNMTPEGLVRYRELIEHKQPLEIDVLRMNLDLLPKSLQSWANNKKMFDKIDEECIEEENKKILRRLGKKKAEEFLIRGLTGTIEKESFQQLLADCGEFYTFQQLTQMLHVHHNSMAVMQQLRARYARKNAFSNTQASKIDGEDVERVYRDGFLSWIMSGREKPEVHFFEKLFIKSKTKISRVFKELMLAGIQLKTAVKELRERDILHPRILGGLKMDQCRMESLLEIGKTQDVDNGLSAQIIYTKVEKATQAFAEMRLPRGCGTALTFDFLVRSDASEVEVRLAVNHLNSVVSEHFDRDLQRLPLFHSWKVYSHKNADDMLVLRIAICFDKTSSIDYCLRELDLGFTFGDLVSEFSVEGQCSLNITDLFDSKRVVLEKKLALRSKIVVTFARGLLVKLMEELLLHEEEGKMKEDVIYEEEAAIQTRQDERTAESHPENPNFGKIKIGVDIKKVTKTGLQLETQRVIIEQRRRRLWHIVGLFKGTKGSLVEFSFKSINEVFFGSKLIAGWVPAWLTKDMFLNAGTLAIWWRGFASSMHDYIIDLQTKILSHKLLITELATKLEKEEMERLGGMNEMAKRREQLAIDKARLAHRLSSLGIAMDPSLLKKDVVEKSDEELRREWKTTQTSSQTVVLKTLGGVMDSCVGVCGMTLLSGTSRFDVSLQGFDIFELFPEFEVSVGNAGGEEKEKKKKKFDEDDEE